MAAPTMRSQTPGDDTAILTLSHLTRPDFPTITVDEYRPLFAALPTGTRLQRLVAEQDGDIVAFGELMEMFWVERPGSFQVDIRVHPDHRTWRIGNRIWESFLATLGAWEGRRVHAQFLDGCAPAHTFAARLGFTPTGMVSRISRLVPRDAVFEGYNDLAARLAAQGITVRSLAEVGTDESFLRAVYDVNMSVARDEPASEAFSVPFEQWRDHFLSGPGLSLETDWVALYGDQPIGFTRLQRAGAASAWHEGLGVERAHRGRGVARLLKLRTIEWARENDIEYLYTGNDINNPRMYDINHRLGYRQIGALVEVARDL